MAATFVAVAAAEEARRTAQASRVPGAACAKSTPANQSLCASRIVARENFSRFVRVARKVQAACQVRQQPLDSAGELIMISI